MSILSSWIKGTIEKEERVCKLLGIFLMYLNEITPISKLTSANFRR